MDRLSGAFVLATLLLASAAPASAQPVERPYRALFGGAAAEAAPRRALDLSVSFMESYDDNVLGDLLNLVVPKELSRGFYSGLSAGASFRATGRRLQLAAAGGGDVRYYPAFDAVVAANRYAALGLTADLSPRTTLFLNQSVSFAPAFFYALVPRDRLPSIGDESAIASVPSAGSDFTLGTQAISVYEAGASLTTRLGPRSAVVVLGRFQRSAGGSDLPVQELRASDAGGRFTYNLTRSAALRLGYVRREGVYRSAGGPTRSITVHDIDSGVDYTRPLSASRRTVLDFSMGSAILNPPAGGSEAGRLQARVFGGAGLSRDIARTWRARLTYSRGIGLIEAFPEPVLSERIGASLGGFLSRRTDVQAAAGASKGDLAIGEPLNALRMYDAVARLRVAVAANLALTAEYLFYDYSVVGRALAPDVVPQRLRRNSVRVGVALWAPLVRR